MRLGFFVILSALLVTEVAAGCNKEDCEIGLSVGVGVAGACTKIGSIACAFTGWATMGLSCAMSVACGVTGGIAAASREACKACGHGGSGAGVKADQLSSQIKELSIKADIILNRTMELEGQIQLTQIIALYGEDITNYQKVKEAFDRLEKDDNGLVIPNFDQEAFENAALSANHGAAASSMQIFKMLTTGHILIDQSIFQVLPETCQNGAKDFFIKAMTECAVLESVAKSMRGENISLTRVHEFKEQLILIEDQFINDCGCPKSHVMTTRQSGLLSAMESLAQSQPSGHCSSQVTYQGQPIPSFIMDDLTDRHTLKKINLLYSTAPFSAAKSADAKAIAEKHRIEEVELAQNLSSHNFLEGNMSSHYSLEDLTLFENHLFCATGCATVYEHDDYQGQAVEIQKGITDCKTLIKSGFNDKASSIRVNPGCEVEFWENDANGKSATSAGDFPSFLTKFDNMMSSIRCDCWRGSPTTLKLVEVSKMRKVYDDGGSGADVSIWRADTESKDYLFSLGDVAVSHHSKPSSGFLVVLANDTQDSLRLPDDYSFIWHNAGMNTSRRLSIWRPVCPAGFVALGDVATETLTHNNGPKPRSGSIYCVNSKFTSIRPHGYWSQTWQDRGSGSDTDVSLWRASCRTNQQSLDTFVSKRAYGKVDFQPYCLKK